MTKPIQDQTSSSCSVCNASIMSNGVVQFANGTRAQLYARVCKFTQNQACINRNQVNRRTIMVTDGFVNGQGDQDPAVEWKLLRTWWQGRKIAASCAIAISLYHLKLQAFEVAGRLFIAGNIFPVRSHAICSYAHLITSGTVIFQVNLDSYQLLP